MENNQIAKAITGAGHDVAWSIIIASVIIGILC